jgi:hypothetical protein
MSNDTGITEDFNASAQAFIRGDANKPTLPALLVKYATLMRHKAKTPEEKGRLAEILLDSGLTWLRNLVNIQEIYYIDKDHRQNLEPLFAALAAPGSISSIPARAPQDLADAALALADATTRDCSGSGGDFAHAYRTGMAGLAQMALEYADTFQAQLDRQAEDIMTSKPVGVSRPIVLKAKEP